MKKTILLSTILLGLSLVSCGNNGENNNNSNVMISLSNYALTIEKFESTKLECEVVGFDGAVTFETSNESVAKVDKNGNVIAVEPGNCVVTAIAKDARAECEITIINPTAAATLYSEVSEITLLEGDVYTFDLYALYKGNVVEDAAFNVDFVYENGKEVADVSYSLKNKEVTVTAKKEGSAVVELTSNTRDTMLYKSISISVL